MDKILELAGQLGELIAADPRGERMANAQARLQGSADDRQNLAEYETKQRALHELQVQGKPIEPEDKRALADLHAKVVGSEAIKELSKAQMDFAELMSAISKRIEQEVLRPRAES